MKVSFCILGVVLFLILLNYQTVQSICTVEFEGFRTVEFEKLYGIIRDSATKNVTYDQYKTNLTRLGLSGNKKLDFKFFVKYVAQYRKRPYSKNQFEKMLLSNKEGLTNTNIQGIEECRRGLEEIGSVIDRNQDKIKAYDKALFDWAERKRINRADIENTKYVTSADKQAALDNFEFQMNRTKPEYPTLEDVPNYTCTICVNDINLENIGEVTVDKIIATNNCLDKVEQDIKQTGGENIDNIVNNNNNNTPTPTPMPTLVVPTQQSNLPLILGVGGGVLCCCIVVIALVLIVSKKSNLHKNNK